MAGYTPLFHSITTGTLCGKWPDIGLWPIILSLSDKHGVVDVTHQYISTITGLAIQEVVDCMSRFGDPDPESRTSDSEGRRLELIDPNREWGWRIINHRKYSEKVRLIHKNAREVESGKNKDRKAGESKTAADRRSPPQTAPQAQAQAQSQTKQGRARKRAPADFTVTVEMCEWAEATLGLQASAVQFETEKFMDHEFKDAKKDWPATWRNWMRKAKDMPSAQGSRKTRFEELFPEESDAA